MHVLSSLIGLLLLMGAASANAEPGVRDVPVRVASVGKIIEDGSAAMVRVATVCPRGWGVLESFVYLVQDGNQSFEGFFTPSCDGARHAYKVRVEAVDFTFHQGEATASAYILLMGPGGQERQGQDYRTVTLHT
ncbi:MAG TPA: hypothetical protein VF986_02710 [Actinomycetota bacterium]